MDWTDVAVMVVPVQTEYIEEGEYADDVQPGNRSTFDLLQFLRSIIQLLNS